VSAPTNSLCPHPTAHNFTVIADSPPGIRVRICFQCGVVEAMWDRGQGHQVCYYRPEWPAVTHPEGK
jgi:hypothetical protein